jgi:protein-L-isoaspartate(D-aspartate) O-methyltransferase
MADGHRTNIHGQVALVMALRGAGITDIAVLEAMEKIPRDIFVEEPFRTSAFEDSALPIACGQTISQPYIVAYMTAALEISPKMRVLEIGTGSGYQAAVLSPLCRMVYTIERHRPLLDEARARFQQLKLHNVVSKHGDGYKGWPEQAPFDRIILTAAVPEIPASLIEQLKPGGILIAPLAKTGDLESISQHLTKIIRGENGVSQQTLIPAVFVPMVPGMPQEVRTSDAKERPR